MALSVTLSGGDGPGQSQEVGTLGDRGSCPPAAQVLPLAGQLSRDGEKEGRYTSAQ